MAINRKQYNSSFKFKVAMQLIRGEETLQQICSQHCLHASVVQRWKKQLMDNGPNIFDDGHHNKNSAEKHHEITSHLERKIGQLTMEVDFLKGALERSA